MLHVFPLGQRLASRNFSSLKVRKAMKLRHGDNCIINKQKKKNVRQKRLVIGWTSKIHKGAYYRCPPDFSRQFMSSMFPNRAKSSGIQQARVRLVKGNNYLSESCH